MSKTNSIEKLVESHISSFFALESACSLLGEHSDLFDSVLKSHQKASGELYRVCYGLTDLVGCQDEKMP